MDIGARDTNRSGRAERLARRLDRPSEVDLDVTELEVALALIRLQVATRVRLSNLRHPYRAAARVAAKGPIPDVNLSIDRGRRPSLLIESSVA